MSIIMHVVMKLDLDDESQREELESADPALLHEYMAEAADYCTEAWITSVHHEED